MAKHANFHLIADHVASARCFYLDPSVENGERPSVTSAGRRVWAGGRRVTRSGIVCEPVGDPSCRVLEFVSGGAGEVTLDGRTTAIASGAFFSYGPTTRRRIVCDAHGPLIAYFVAFAGRAERTSIERHLPEPGTVGRTSAPADIARLFDELIRTGLRRDEHVRRMLALELDQLVLRLAETALPLDSRVSPALLTYDRCRHYIQEHWAEISTLEQLARACGVVPGYVCRLFKRFDHRSPYQYLLQQKMAHAADRLARSGVGVGELAQELGFGDPFHFSRVFKRTMGLAPVHFARICARKRAAGSAGPALAIEASGRSRVGRRARRGEPQPQPGRRPECA